MRLRVQLGDSPRIHIEDGDAESFRRSALWKLRMPAVRRNAVGFDGDAILLKPDLSRVERKAVTECLERLAPQAFELTYNQAAEAATSGQDSLLDEKSRVGLAVKAHSAEVLPEYLEFKQVVDDAMVRPLRERQMWDAFYMCTMRSSANFSVPGSGKTASTLGTFAYLRERRLVRRLLVICPKNAFGSWRDEWAACFGNGLECRSLCFHDERFAGASTAAKRRELKLNAGRYNLILINYESTVGLADELGELAAAQTMLVFDEVHKVKQIGGVRASSALEIASDAQYVVALTGTPIPNSYCDLYNLLHILYPHDYDSFFGFRPKRLAKPSDQEMREINESLQPFFCRTNKTSLGVPAASSDLLYRVPATSVEQHLLDHLKWEYRHDGLALIIRILQLESDPSMLGLGLGSDEIEGLFDEEREGILPLDPLPEELESLVAQKQPSSKTDECVMLADQLLGEGKPLIIWCFFKRSMRNLRSHLRRLGWMAEIIDGSVDQQSRDTILGQFKAGGVDALITNPHTLAESVSLHSVCHDAIYFEYSYNLVHLLQSKDRIHRLGLPQGQYTQYHFLQSVFDVDGADWSLDENIYNRLSEKEQTMLDAIDRGVLEVGSTDDHDLEMVFEGLFGSEQDES